MNTIQNDEVNSRRGFLKKSGYLAPAILMLGSLNVYGSGDHGDSKSPCNSSLKGNNGFGNGDQDAPGHSLHHNNAENATDEKNRVNNVGVETHGGHEKDMEGYRYQHNDHDNHDKTSSKAPSFKLKNS